MIDARAQTPDSDVRKALEDAVRTYPPGDYKTVIPQMEPSTTLELKRPNAGPSPLRRKLDGIYFPKVEFRDAAPLKVFEWLAAESVSLDPNREGVAVAIDIQVLQGVDGQKPFEQPITLSLQNVSLGNALQTATGALKMRYDTEGNTVIIRPKK